MKTNKFLASVLIGSLALSSFPTNIFANDSCFEFDENTSKIYHNKGSLGKTFCKINSNYFEIPNEIEGKKILNVGDFRIEKENDTNTKINLKISEGIKELSGNFNGGNSFNEVYLPDSLEKIGNYTFQSKWIEKIIFGNNLKEIGEKAFYSNIELKEILLPDSLEKIGENAFRYNKIQNLEIGNNLKNIPNGFIAENELTSVNIPDNIINIGDYSFWKNKITNLVLGKKVENIGRTAFSNNNLTEIIIPNSVKTIGENAFLKENSNSRDNYVKGIVSSEEKIKEICSNTKIKTNNIEDCEKYIKLKFEIKPDLFDKTVAGNNNEEKAKNFLKIANDFLNKTEDNINQVELENFINQFRNLDNEIKDLILKESLNIEKNLVDLLFKVKVYNFKNNITITKDNTSGSSPKEGNLNLDCDDRVKVVGQECKNNKEKKDNLEKEKSQIEKYKCLNKNECIILQNGKKLYIDTNKFLNSDLEQFYYDFYMIYEKNSENFKCGIYSWFTGCYYKIENIDKGIEKKEDILYSIVNTEKKIDDILNLYVDAIIKIDNLILGEIKNNILEENLDFIFKKPVDKLGEYQINLSLGDQFYNDTKTINYFKGEGYYEMHKTIFCIMDYYKNNTTNKNFYKNCFPKKFIDNFRKKDDIFLIK